MPQPTAPEHLGARPARPGNGPCTTDNFNPTEGNIQDGDSCQINTDYRGKLRRTL